MHQDGIGLSRERQTRSDLDHSYQDLTPLCGLTTALKQSISSAVAIDPAGIEVRDIHHG